MGRGLNLENGYRPLLHFYPSKTALVRIGKHQSTVLLTGTMRIRRHSVNRPPTPDARDDDEDAREKEPTLVEIVNIKLIESGEKERLMELVRERLVECGWKDEMKALCRAYIKQNGRDNVTVDDLVQAITPKGRASIPDSVKAELLQKIRSFLVSVAH